MLLVGCGRVGFDATADARAADATPLAFCDQFPTADLCTDFEDGTTNWVEGGITNGNYVVDNGSLLSTIDPLATTTDIGEAYLNHVFGVMGSRIVLGIDVRIDQAGQVLLLYTAGRVDGTYLMCERWDLSDLDQPKHIGEDWRNQVTIAGLHGRDGGYASLNNADAMYDATSGHIYLVADGWPCYLEGVDEPGEPTFINSTVRVLRYSPAIAPDDLGKVTFQDGAWDQVALITSADSGFPRNHNPGLVHDPYGWALSPDTLDVLYSVSEVGKPNNSLWTYRIHRLTIDLPR
jgi:hypothetical protein